MNNKTKISLILQQIKLIIVLVVIALIFTTTTFAQNLIKIKGRVLDRDSLPIPFVHIYIPDVLLGTVSNTLGEFVLSINGRYLNDSLYISTIGYDNKSISIESLESQNTTIILRESEYLLNDVVIKPDLSDSARIIMSKAISRLKTNYSSKLYYIDGFYREVNYKDSLALRLIEAAVRINSKAYKADKENLNAEKLKVNILQLRKSDDNRTYTIWSKISNLMFGEQNSLYKVFEYDIIRYLDKNSKHFLNKNAVENLYDYNIEDIIVNNLDTIYVIKSVYKNRIQTRYMKFYVNNSDWAIIRFEEQVRFNEEISVSKEMREKLLIIKSTVQYSKYRGKYYLSLIDLTDLTNGDGFLDYGELQFSKIQLMINNVFLKKDLGFEKIKRKDSATQYQNLYDIKNEYNPSFWKNYNMILYAPLKSTIVSDLEKEKTLANQFKDNH